MRGIGLPEHGLRPSKRMSTSGRRTHEDCTVPNRPSYDQPSYNQAGDRSPHSRHGIDLLANLTDSATAEWLYAQHHGRC